MNCGCSRCTDWKFYTWFHLYSTNGYIIAPFHHFPSLGDIKESSLRELRNGEHIRQEIWKMLKSDHAYFYLSLSWEGEKNPLWLSSGSSKEMPLLFSCWNAHQRQISLTAFCFPPWSVISHPPQGSFHQLKTLRPSSYRWSTSDPSRFRGLPANCSDMSDMLVCLVTPHSSTVTKVRPTPCPPLRSSEPKWLEETWGVTESQSQGQECSPPHLLSKQPLPLLENLVSI